MEEIDFNIFQLVCGSFGCDPESRSSLISRCHLCLAVAGDVVSHVSHKSTRSRCMFFSLGDAPQHVFFALRLAKRARVSAAAISERKCGDAFLDCKDSQLLEQSHEPWFNMVQYGSIWSC